MGPDQGRVTISAVDKYDNFHFTVDFLKVLRFSFPVPVVSSLSLAFAAENKKSNARTSRSWKDLSSSCRQI